VILTHISNFRKVKRVVDVLYIFERVQRQKAAKLLLVGDGPEIENLKQETQVLGLEQKVHFLGKSHRIEHITAISDILLLPSEAESFGLVALEAMGAGVAIISSDVGGLPEVNVEGKTGYLRPVGGIEAMTQATLSILHDEKTLNRFKQNAIQHSKKFDIKHVLPQYERLYRSLT
jgi:N-acetyl-alpha-D-glucosaminyl L-malate synthase BshA